MKVQIRTGLFETNSSSVHSCTIASMSDYRDWREGKLMVCLDNGEFVSIEEGRRRNALEFQTRRYDHPSIEEIREYSENGTIPSCIDLYELNYLTYDQYYDKCGDNEDYVETSSKFGVVAFGYYGYD